MARSRPTSPAARAGGFDATQLAWPTLSASKELPRRRRRTLGAALRTSTCPPIFRGRHSAASTRSSADATQPRRASPSPSPSPSPRTVGLKARTECTPTTACAISHAPWRRRQSTDGCGDDILEAKAEEATPQPPAVAGRRPATPARAAPVAEASCTCTPKRSSEEEPTATEEEAPTAPDALRMTPQEPKRMAGASAAAKKRISFSAFEPSHHFADWLDHRPPMLRLGNSAGCGWEFPLSRAEKQELLVLNLAAETQVQNEQLEEQSERIEMLVEEIEAESP